MEKYLSGKTIHNTLRFKKSGNKNFVIGRNCSCKEKYVYISYLHRNKVSNNICKNVHRGCLDVGNLLDFFLLSMF